MTIKYSGDASDSYRATLDALSGFTVRLTLDGAAPGTAQDVELIGTTDDGGDVCLAYFPTDTDGSQFLASDPRRRPQLVELIDVEEIYVY